jgi:hypothetical protein
MLKDELSHNNIEERMSKVALTIEKEDYESSI